MDLVMAVVEAQQRKKGEVNEELELSFGPVYANGEAVDAEAAEAGEEGSPAGGSRGSGEGSPNGAANGIIPSVVEQ